MLMSFSFIHMFGRLNIKSKNSLAKSCLFFYHRQVVKRANYILSNHTHTVHQDFQNTWSDNCFILPSVHTNRSFNTLSHYPPQCREEDVVYWSNIGLSNWSHTPHDFYDFNVFLLKQFVVVVLSLSDALHLVLLIVIMLLSLGFH